MNAFFVTIPHSGEKIAEETPWLRGLPEPTLMRDVDRFVDQLYLPAIQELKLDSIKTEWHRYVVDLNRFPEDIDQASVVGAEKPAGQEPKGFHWSQTTHGETLMPEPMSAAVHDQIRQKYYDAFHHQVEQYFCDRLAQGCKAVFQMDAHSMPSVGTELHPDPGETRAEIVIGDVHGTSCSEDYRALCEAAFKGAGFQVVMNWPYKGGRITQRYGRPQENRHAIQIEMNRKIYMNEETKKLDVEGSLEVSRRVTQSLKYVVEHLPSL